MGFFGGGSSVDLTSPGPIGSTTPDTGAFTTLSATPPANTTAFNSTGYSLTGTNAQTLLNLTGTWNTSGTPTAIKLNVTDTASNASSLLMDLQVGGTSKLSMDKTSLLVIGSDSGTIKIGSTAASRVGIRNFGGSLGLQTSDGTLQGYVATTGIIIGDTKAFQWNTSGVGGTVDLYLYRDAAAILAQRNGTNAQSYRLYRTYTDASNYERLGFLTTNTTRYTITSQNAGTGSARSLEVSFYTSASDPTSSDITSGCFSVWKNSGTSIIKLWANDGGTMKSVALV
jgi:hypothetical protein